MVVTKWVLRVLRVSFSGVSVFVAFTLSVAIVFVALLVIGVFSIVGVSSVFMGVLARGVVFEVEGVFWWRGVY